MTKKRVLNELHQIFLTFFWILKCQTSEDFEQDPLTKAEEIYEKLQLGDFQSVKPLMAAYVGEKRGFKKNKYQYDERTVNSVNKHWRKAVDQWGYEI